MIAELLRHLMGEKHDFYAYIDMYQEASEPAIKMKLKEIAMQELRHYKDIMDIVFKEDPARKGSPLEQAFKQEVCDGYKEMEEKVRELK